MSYFQSFDGYDSGEEYDTSLHKVKSHVIVSVVDKPLQIKQ